MSYGITAEQSALMTGAIPVKIKRLHPDAVIPRYATDGAAGFDLVAVEDVIVAPGETVKVPLGLAFEIPEGYVMYVCMRSGIALKTKLRQPNGIGVIDSDYRGEVAMMFDNIAPNSQDNGYLTYVDGSIVKSVFYEHGTHIISKGDRVAQGILAKVPRAEFVEVTELGETERGIGGFGSSGMRAEVSE